MNRVQIPLLKHVPSSQLLDGTSELAGPTVNVSMFPASSHSRKRSAGLKAKHQAASTSGGGTRISFRSKYVGERRSEFFTQALTRLNQSSTSCSKSTGAPILVMPL